MSGTAKLSRFKWPFVENRIKNGKNRRKIEIALKCNVNKHASTKLAGQCYMRGRWLAGQVLTRLHVANTWLLIRRHVVADCHVSASSWSANVDCDVTWMLTGLFQCHVSACEWLVCCWLGLERHISVCKWVVNSHVSCWLGSECHVLACEWLVKLLIGLRLTHGSLWLAG